MEVIISVSILLLWLCFIIMPLVFTKVVAATDDELSEDDTDTHFMRG